MRPHMIVLASLSLLGCATLKTGGKVAPSFQGETVLQNRQKEVQDKLRSALQSLTCPQQTANEMPDGIVEITADAQGKLTTRTMSWKSSQALLGCLTDAIGKTTVAPLPGPSITLLLPFGSNVQIDQPSKDLQDKIKSVIVKISPQAEVCAHRYLPPELPVDIRVQFAVFEGGKPGGLNVVQSNAKDGDYEVCIYNLIHDTSFPASSDGKPYQAEAHFHAGRSNAAGT